MNEADQAHVIPPDRGPGWIIDGRLETENPLLSVKPADLEEANEVLRLWSWSRGSILVRGLAPGNFGPLPAAGGIADQGAVLMDAFELLRHWDFQAAQEGDL
jgi:hypothetical protein